MTFRTAYLRAGSPAGSLTLMARFITVYHPKLKETATVAEAGFYAKGGLRDKGWELATEDPKPASSKRTAKPKTDPDPEEG